MKKIECEITGQTPLLMNSPKWMLEEQDTTTIKTQKRDKKEEAEKVAYRKKNDELYIPAAAIKGCILDASSFIKFGKFSAKPIIAGNVRIEPEEIGLGVKTYDIDIRTVVIQRNRVPKARPRLEKWKVKFDIIYDEEMIPDPAVLKKVLEDGGKRVGVLDFRPKKSGNFGTFKVTKFTPKK